MLKQLTVVATLLVCSGCATQFYNASTAGPLLESTSQLAPSTLRAHSSCMFAFVATGAVKADFIPGACAHSDTTLYIYSWDASLMKYRREIEVEFAKLGGVAKAKLGAWTQLQVPVDGGQIVFEPKPADAFYDVLLKAGVAEQPSTGYVHVNAPPQPTTIYIPVYIPG
jgi:hypothetical protein